MTTLRPILVVGTHRSGTSLVAGMLFYLGIFMGEYFLKRSIHCPLGFFEDVEFIVPNFNRVQGKIPKEGWKVVMDEFKKKRDEKGLVWGVKDPNASFFINELIEMWNPKIIWCKRDKKETLKSYKKVYGNKIENPEKLMSDINTRLEEVLKNKEHLVIHAEETLQDPAYIVGRLAGYLNLNPDETHKAKARRLVLRKDRGGLSIMEAESFQDYL